MIRLNRWLMGGVLFIILAALFVDTYSYTYRFLIEHKPLGAKLSQNPHIGGLQLYIHKGLDISGGTELTIAICQGFNNPPGSGCRNGPPKGANPAALQNNTITVLQQRVNSLGVSEASVQAQGSDQVLVQIPGVDLQTAQNVIGTTARLYFATAVQGPANPSNPQFLADQQGLYNPAQFGNEQFYPQESPGWHWKIDTNIDATDVTSATENYNPTEGYVVDISFNSHGADEWSKITTAAFAQTAGTPQNRIAIFLDNNVLTAPDVQAAQTNTSEISGNFTSTSASTLANQITAGALPAEIATLSATEVSATLGAQTVRESLIAGLVGLIVVVLFMIGYYRFPGLLASIALLCYASIVLALYKLIPVTISLAGLAGFVLSVGMAVDANVLIFERTRDELRHGRSVPLSVEAGFRRAWPAIRDSNISTMIACVVLWAFGTDVVKGFALTLGLGVAVSMFSAILITQSLFVGVINWRRARDPRLYTEIHEEYEANPPKGKFDIVRTRNWYFVGSLAIIIPGILAILFWGFRLGLDFAGGNSITAQFVKPTTQAQVQAAVNSVAADLQPTVQSTSGNTFTVQTLPSSIEEVQTIENKLGSEFQYVKDLHGVPNVQTQTVGPTIAASLVRNSILLVILASVLISVYLAVRFRTQTISRWRFSICTLFKLLHDVFVLAGIWAVIGHFSSIAQVDTLFVTAILTSVSFSIHDTIVVFDRIRENLRTGPRLTFDQVVNLSTVQTMTRSLNTALTVTFVLFALVLFGGEFVRGFVLALLIGIVTGTYSSIFNASTLLIAWQSIDRERPGAQPPGQPGQRRVSRARVAS